MNSCLAKYLDAPELIRSEAVNILKHLVFACTVGELMRLENSRELPACITLLIKALLHDIEAGWMGTLNSILDSVFQL
jgi:hypothetical protein